MKTNYCVCIASIFSLVIFSAIAVSASNEQSLPVITIADLNYPNKVQGRLGQPLGRIITVDAEVVDGKETRVKALEGATVLRVLRVENKELPGPMISTYTWLPTVPTKKLAGRVRFLAYETGAFVGVPHESFEHILPFAAQGFYFQTSLVIVKAL